MMANTLCEHQLLDRCDATLRLAQVVLADQHQLAAVDAALLVEFVEIDLVAVHRGLPSDVNRAGDGPNDHLDLRVVAPNVGSLRAELWRW
jgi:hypothetical protein